MTNTARTPHWYWDDASVDIGAVKKFHLPGKHVQQRHAGGKGILGSMLPRSVRGQQFRRPDDDAWMRENYQDWWNTLDPQEADLLNQFTINSRSLNGNARNMSSNKAPSVRMKRMDNIFNEIPGVPENILVHRGLVSDRFNKDVNKDFVGSIISDKGYVSTSLLESIGSSFAGIVNQADKLNSMPVQFKILIPQGAKGIPLGFLRQSEAELTLPRNSKLGIVNDVMRRGVRFMDAELLP